MFFLHVVEQLSTIEEFRIWKMIMDIIFCRCKTFRIYTTRLEVIQ